MIESARRTENLLNSELEDLRHRAACIFLPNLKGSESNRDQVLIDYLSRSFSLSIYASNDDIHVRMVRDFLIDHLNDLIINGDESFLNDFINIYSFRYQIYKNKLIDLYRKQRPRLSEVDIDLLSGDEEESSFGFDKDILAGAFTTIVENITDENDRNRLLIILDGVLDGSSMEEIANRLGISSKSAPGEIYKRIVQSYLKKGDLDLPDSLKELRELVHGVSRRTLMRRKKAA